MLEPNTKSCLKRRRGTRKDLLRAAQRLLNGGLAPTMDDVAAEAQLSRATAYRYFPRVEALFVEAPLDGVVPDPERLFARLASTDPEERLDRAEAALHWVVYQNETQMRHLLSHAVEAGARANRTEAYPIRQNRRMPLFQAALAPARRRFSDSTYDRLCASLALVFGPESMYRVPRRRDSRRPQGEGCEALDDRRTRAGCVRRACLTGPRAYPLEETTP